MPDSQRSTVLVLILSVALVASAAFVGVGFGQETGDDTNETDATETETELTTQSTSYLRVAHAAAGAGNVDVLVDNETVAEDVAFGDFSGYMPVESGDRTVTVTIANSPDEVVFNETLTVEPRTATTVTAAVNASAGEGVSPFAYEDDAVTPMDDESALRIVHLSPNAPAVDVVAVTDDGATETETETNETEETETNETEETETEAEETATETETGENATEAAQVDGDTVAAQMDENATAGETVLAENVSYTNATDYMTVPAGDYTVEIRVAEEDNDGAVVATTDVTLESGVAYSAWAIGNVPEDGEEVTPTFRVLPTEDASSTIMLPSEMPGDNETEAPADGENETETPGEEETTEEETTEEEATDEETTDEAATESPAEGETTETEAGA
jgi:hypothetical protein